MYVSTYKIGTLVLFVLIILSFNEYIFSQSFSDESWFWQYPKPQGNTLRDIYVFDSLKAIAVGDIGTIIKTYDGGKSWDVQHHTGGTDIDLFSIHFTDTLNGWACGGIDYTDKNVLLKTNDGGKEWIEIKIDMRVQADTTLPFKAVYFVDTDTGFVVGEDGIVLRTTDGGNNWDIRKMDNYIGYYLDIFRLKEITFTDKQTGWIVGEGYFGNEIYKTTDCGRTWQWDEWIVNPKVGGLNDIQFINKNNGFIVGYSGIFLKTTDGGVSWQRKNLVDKYNKVEYNHFHSVCFTDSLDGFIAGGGFILRTTDGGENWEELSTYYGWYKIRFVNKDLSINKVGWSVGSSIYKTTDKGEKWFAQREKQFYFRSIYFLDEINGWAVGDSGVIIRTEDGGINWIKQNQNDSLLFNSIFAIDKENAFAVGAVLRDFYSYKNAIILNTTNGGLTWDEKIIDSIFVLKSVYFNNNNIGWAVGNSSLLKTTDGGLDWYPQNSEMVKLSYLDKIQFVNDQIGWIIDNSDSTILKTINGGKTWTKYKTETSMWLQSLFFLNENLGWAVGNYQGINNIQKTIDGGETWVPQNAVYADISSVFFINDNIGWVCGFDNLLRVSVIFKTTDGGKSWYKQNCPIKNEWNLSDIFFSNENTGWAVGNGIIKTTNGGGIVNVSNEKELYNTIPNQIELFQNYPNPFNPITTIKYALPKESDVQLIIYDILGREVKNLVNGYNSTGYKEVVWNGMNNNGQQVTSGIYICRLKATSLEDLNVFEKSIKLLLMK
jgi:photosystem II stability/assembly factor-like uncharacterized protein